MPAYSRRWLVQAMTTVMWYVGKGHNKYVDTLSLLGDPFARIRCSDYCFVI